MLSVVLLSGKQHYCREYRDKNPLRESMLDPYYLVAGGQSINKTWWVGSACSRVWQLLSTKGSLCVQPGRASLPAHNFLGTHPHKSLGFTCAHPNRCQASDPKFAPSRQINTSHYHSEIGVEVPAWNITTEWARDLHRFDNVVTGIWVLYQVR